jgi:integrase
MARPPSKSPDRESERPEPKKRRSKKRARGEGALFKITRRGRVTWIGRKTVGVGLDGRPIVREVSAPTQAECRERLEGLDDAGLETPVATWGQTWLSSVDVRPATLADYKNTVRIISEKIGKTQLGKVSATTVSAMLMTLKREGYPPSTLAKFRDHGRSMFEAARKSIDRLKNPFADAPRPKVEPEDIDALSPVELSLIVAEANTYPAGRLIALLAGVGCRLGEASALLVSDYHPATGKLAITKTYSKQFGVGPPKSRHSKRTITVPPTLRPLLVAAIGGRKSGNLFETRNRRPYLKALVQEAFARLLKRLGMKPRNLHSMRHGVATCLISRGVPIGDVARFLGDRKETIVRVYLHHTDHDPSEDMEAVLKTAG